MTMAMSFESSPRVTLWFAGLESTGWLSYTGLLVLVFAMGVAQEALMTFRMRLRQRRAKERAEYSGPPGVFLESEPTLTHKAEAPRTSRSKPTATLALKQQAITLARNNLAKKHWFHSLPFQR